ncbi:aldehyde dehydrogenase family protein [Novosphingobium sp. FGD1]|uniref:Aldehyde dehydrogenase family protein n=1 Tax=Novosphingobium silvae TaxID=2692619 RepID=A0A7X4GJJ2_9SPHN|nr:aldehyde dehydrogenase family protein [Novosphingobium silvae]MYL99738.1 aldehyde dehydrogenase family protein [Novosphingobium silvae]
MSTYSMTIAGKAVESNETITVINPATGVPLAEAPDCSSDQLDEAVAAARTAFPAWRAMSDSERGEVLKAAAARLASNVDELARLLTSEQGKPLDEARFEVMGAAYWLSSLADIVIPVEINEDTQERRSETRHLPLGVVAGISPWNFPVLLSFWKIAPALRAGNTMILKPSPFTPLTMLRIGELLRGVIPDGVLNIITGGDALGPKVTAHPGIDKVSFTGSTATGKRVMASAAADLKRVTLELGGNDAAIVLPDVDVDVVAKDLFWAAFRNSAQICIATKRMYVHEEIYDRLAQAISDYARTVQMGDGAQQGIALGPVQNRQQYERVVNILDDCKAQGFKFLTGGTVEVDKPGYFIPVTIVDNPPELSRVVQEEAFGPILPLLKFNDVDDVVARANASEYGLAGSVWSADTDAALAIAARLETGTVWINEVQHLSPFQAFAGHKQSGLGVENGLGGLLEYTIPQTVTVRAAKVA